jgi:CRP-like cAMP-binding protein
VKTQSIVIKAVDIPNTGFEPGTILFKEGDPGDGFFIVREGEVDIVKGHGTLAARTLATVTAGQVVGEISALDHGPRFATAIAKTRCLLSPVPNRAIDFQLSELPTWFQIVIRDLVGRMRATTEVLSKHP